MGQWAGTWANLGRWAMGWKNSSVARLGWVGAELQVSWVGIIRKVFRNTLQAMRAMGT